MSRILAQARRTLRAFAVAVGTRFGFLELGGLVLALGAYLLAKPFLPSPAPSGAALLVLGVVLLALTLHDIHLKRRGGS